MEWIPRRGHSVWARKSGKPAWASRNISPIQNFMWNLLNSGPLRTSPFLGSETGPPRQNAKLRLALRAQQSGASGILESRPPGASSLIDLGSMELLPQTLRFPARMPSLAWPSERSRAEWSGFRSAATPFGPENLENQLEPPETFPQCRISYLELAQLWAVAHLPLPGRRNWASSPECQASLGPQNAAERSFTNPRVQAPSVE